MNYKNAKEAREFRQSLRDKEVKILAEVAQNNHEWTADQRAAWDKMEADYEVVEGDIKRLETAETRAAMMAKASPAQQEATQSESDKIRRYLLTGEIPNDRLSFDPNEQRANTQTITTTGGGYTIDSMLGPDISKALKAYGGIMENARIIQTMGGNPFYWPTVDDTTVTPASSINGHILSINTAATTDADAVAFGQAAFSAYKATSGMIQIPRELIEDSGFDIESFILNDLMAERVMRVMDYYLVKGSGSSQPKGVIASATYGEVLTASGAFTRTDLLNLVHSLDPDYRKSDKAFIIMADSTLKVIRAITDDYGKPLYNPDPRLGAPDTIEGMKVLINQRMDAIGTAAPNNKPILVGDLSRFGVRLAGNIRLVRTSERFIDSDQIGVAAFWRFDSNILNSGAIKYGYESAS